MRKTIPDISARKGEGHSPIVCLTAYTAPMARMLDPHCDVLLVGDSIAMVLYGEPSTLQADMDMMIRHGRAVQNASTNALVVIDMPFGTYQESKEAAFKNAARILRETGASSVKLEGGAEMAQTISYLAARGVPVMGHIGLQPQNVNAMGGFKAQGLNEKSAAKIMADAKAVAQAGAYAIVLEGVAESLAADITKAVPCPVIGIGASAACNGQILVSDDMLGLSTGKKPRFVKPYANLGESISQAVKSYAEDVRARRFPASEHTYSKPQENNAPASTTIAPLPVHQDVKPSTSSLGLSITEKQPAPERTAQPEAKPDMQPALQSRPALSQDRPKPLNIFEGVLRATPKKRDY